MVLLSTLLGMYVQKKFSALLSNLQFLPSKGRGALAGLDSLICFKEEFDLLHKDAPSICLIVWKEVNLTVVKPM